VNASYVYGLQIINAHMRRALGTLTMYDAYAKATDLLIIESEDNDTNEDGVEVKMVTPV
jgi:hypothetical protein